MCFHLLSEHYSVLFFSLNQIGKDYFLVAVIMGMNEAISKHFINIQMVYQKMRIISLCLGSKLKNYIHEKSLKIPVK